MRFKSTPIPPLPPGTTSRAKLPVVALTENNAMNLDNKYGVEDFVAEIAAISEDPNTDEDDKFEFCGFHRPVHTSRSEEEEDGIEEGGKEEDDSGPLYRMEALTSEVDALISSPSKASDNFLPSASEGDEDWVVGKGRYVKTKDAKEMTIEKKTKGALLQEMITACNGGNKDPTDQAPHGLVNSESTGLYVLLSPSP